MIIFLSALIALIIGLWLVNFIEWLAVGICNYTYAEWVKATLQVSRFIKTIKYIISRLW